MTSSIYLLAITVALLIIQLAVVASDRVIRLVLTVELYSS